MIRPKILYQFLNLDKFVEKDGKVYKIVYIVGGIGEKFVRPYSIIGYMANKLVFNIQNGNLQQIQRINMQNIIPVNTYSAVKMRAPMEAKILSQAQNRSINFISGQSGHNSYTIYHNNITYNPHNQRFQYENQYQFCDSQYKNYREEVSLLKKTVAQSKTKLGICAKNVRGKDFNTNFITVSLQNDQKYLIQLQLIISLDVKHKNAQLPACVRLTGQSIISIDVNSNVVYALIRHPKYTINQCILAYSDLNEISHKFRQNKPIQVPLKQIYKFDQNVSYNVLVAANINTIVLLHGLKFQKDAHVTQMILRRNRKKHIKIDYIQSNTNYNTHNSDITNKSYISNNQNNNKLQFYDYPSIPAPGGLSCSIFLNQNNGNILCFSFKTIQRNPKSDSVFMIIQKLDLNNDKFIWQVILSKTYQFIISQQKISHTQQPKRRRQKLKLVQIIQHKKQQQNISNNNNYRYFYQFIGIYRDECYSAQYQIDFNNININNNINQKIVFIGNGKNQNQYYKELSKSSIKQNSVFLEKNIEDYNQLEDSVGRFRENTRRENNSMIEDQSSN